MSGFGRRLRLKFLRWAGQARRGTELNRVDVGTSSFYDARSGVLVAIFETDLTGMSCVAGPANLLPPTCTLNLIPPICPDAGTDGSP